MNKMTKQQRIAAEFLFSNGYANWYMFPRAGKNKPYWKLVEMGLAHHDFGPVGSWLQTYCFMPQWTDPVC